MRTQLLDNIYEAAAYLRSRGVIDPEVGIILGTGLNEYADRLENAVRIPYSDVPHFDKGSVAGHYGEVVYGNFEGKRIVIMAGRFHFYEGHSMDKAVLTTRTMAKLGIKRLIITNAAGCINKEWEAGDLMMISDHINLIGDNPLIGPNLDEFGPRFPDMSDAYDRALRTKLKAICQENGVFLREGVYAMMSGPSFETAAEIRFLRVIGADCVGMSSVPEAIIANHAGLELIGISLMANMATGVLDQALSTEEIDAMGASVQDKFSRVVDLAISI